MTGRDGSEPNGRTPGAPDSGNNRDDPASGLAAIRASYADVIDDPERLRALYQLGILDSQPPTVFNDITELLRLKFDVAVARLHLLDNAGLHIKAASGDSAGYIIPVRPSMCQHTIRQDRVLIIPDLDEDPEFGPLKVAVGGRPMRFYAGAPLTTRDGHNVGSLCLLDSRPRDGLEPGRYALLTKIAELTSHMLELPNAGREDSHHHIGAVDQDPVTGLLNRRAVSLQLQRRIEEADDGGTGITVIEFRLDRLDPLESGFGTAARNKVLREIGERLAAEIIEGELIARSDEAGFLLLTRSDATTRAELDATVAARAREVVAALARPVDIAAETFHAEVYAGIARVPPDGSDAHELLDMAHDAAVRAARKAGESIGWPDPDAIAAERDKLGLEARLRRAVERHEFNVHFQPVVALQNGNRVVGAEALLRWPQPEGVDPIGPSVFIPLAEELGLMDAIGTRVFELSCRQLRAWLNEPGGAAIWISVNLAPQQLQDRDLPRRFTDIAAANGISPSQIKLEVTESAIEAGFEAAAQVIDELDQAGFILALDDFGTGHSSLSRLINMPFDVLKVDRSFVDQIPNNPGAAVVASLGQLAHSLRMQCLGEGVETEAHERYLRQRGYDLAQGYRYSEPLLPQAFSAWLRDR
jgi:diguanylate cyclase (GGDEF)-like protein